MNREEPELVISEQMKKFLFILTLILNKTERIKNLQNMQMKENEKKIEDAFSDLDSLRNNTQEMV